MDPTLEELVARFRAGDQDAARELYERFAAEMLALVRWRLANNPVRGALDSGGIVQSGFRSFFRAITKPAFDPKRGSIGGLLATIVSRKALVQLRRKFPVNADPAELGTVANMIGSLLELTEVEVEVSRQEVVAEALEAFTEWERQIIALHLDRETEWSFADIARECRLSETTVEDVIDRFYAALQRLSAGGNLRPGG